MWWMGETGGGGWGEGGREDTGTQLSFCYSAGPEGPNRGTRERTTTEFGTHELNFLTKCSHVNWILVQFQVFGTELFASFEALALKICDFGMKVGSWELIYVEMGVLQMARKIAWKRVFRATRKCFSGSKLQDKLHLKLTKIEHLLYTMPGCVINNDVSIELMWCFVLFY